MNVEYYKNFIMIADYGTLTQTSKEDVYKRQMVYQPVLPHFHKTMLYHVS